MTVTKTTPLRKMHCYAINCLRTKCNWCPTLAPWTEISWSVSMGRIVRSWSARRCACVTNATSLTIEFKRERRTQPNVPTLGTRVKDGIESFVFVSTSDTWIFVAGSFWCHYGVQRQVCLRRRNYDCLPQLLNYRSHSSTNLSRLPKASGTIGTLKAVGTPRPSKSL